MKRIPKRLAAAALLVLAVGACGHDGHWSDRSPAGLATSRNDQPPFTPEPSQQQQAGLPALY